MLKYRAFCQKCVVFEDRWSLMAVVSQDRFHCIMGGGGGRSPFRALRINTQTWKVMR